MLNVMGLTLSAYVMLWYFVEQRGRAHRALKAERVRSERLLLNVLPGPIAERLKVGTGVIADHYETVSVLFADLVRGLLATGRKVDSRLAGNQVP